MKDLLEAAKELHGFMRKRRWQYCVIGGLALPRWGEPRTTQDVDITLLTGYGHETRFVDALLTRFAPRVADAREFARNTRVLLCTASNGIEIDIALGGLPYEEKLIARATPFTFAPRVKLITASAEDLVVLKAFAGRDQDWLDVQGVLKRQHPRLDWPYIERELRALAELKEEADPLDRLAQMKKQVERHLREIDKN